MALFSWLLDMRHAAYSRSFHLLSNRMGTRDGAGSRIDRGSYKIDRVVREGRSRFLLLMLQTG